MMAILNNRLDVSTLVDGLDHAEGVAWGLDGFAYAGGEAGQVYRVDVERGELSQFAQVTGGFILGMALDADNNVYACDTGSHSVVRITQGGLFRRIQLGLLTSHSTSQIIRHLTAKGTCMLRHLVTGTLATGRCSRLLPAALVWFGMMNLSIFPMVCAWGPTGSSFMW